MSLLNEELAAELEGRKNECSRLQQRVIEREKASREEIARLEETASTSQAELKAALLKANQEKVYLQTQLECIEDTQKDLLEVSKSEFGK